MMNIRAQLQQYKESNAKLERAMGEGLYRMNRCHGPPALPRPSPPPPPPPPPRFLGDIKGGLSWQKSKGY